MYYTYVLRCKDETLYTGITTDLERRLKEHLQKEEKGAKYTRVHTPKKIEIAWESENKSLASKLEYHIKTLTKVQKETLIKEPKKLKQLLGQKIDYEKYTIVY